MVHASKRFDTQGFGEILKIAPNMASIAGASPRMAPTGGFVGIVELADCVTESDSEWYQHGCFGFVLKNPRTIPFVPYKGRLGFYDVDASIFKAG